MNYEAQRPNPVEALFGPTLPESVEGFLLIPLPLVLLSVAAGVVIERHTRRRSALKTLIQTAKANSPKNSPKPAAIAPPAPYKPTWPLKRTVVAAAGVKECSLTTDWDNKIPFTELAQSLPLGARRAMLDQALNQHESGWLDKLLCCPCLLVIGRPGSAKSSFAGALAICREVILNSLNETVVADPNAHLKVGDRIWQPRWTLKGSHDDWEDIEDAITAMYKRFADSQGRNYVSSVYDELTTYESKLDASILSGFIEQITSKARASNEYITLVSHNDTLTCLGAKKGQAKLKDDMVKLSLGSRSVARGKFQATGKGCIEGLEFDDKNNPLEEVITLPRWFEPKILKELFPELYSFDLEISNPASGPTSGSTSVYFRSTSTSRPEVGGSRAEVESGSRGSDELARLLRLEALKRKLEVEAEVEAGEVSTFTLEAEWKP